MDLDSYKSGQYDGSYHTAERVTFLSSSHSIKNYIGNKGGDNVRWAGRAGGAVGGAGARKSREGAVTGAKQEVGGYLSSTLPIR